MEDHGGSLNLEDSEFGGARVKLSFPIVKSKHSEEGISGK
jgi:nitrogen fixation/metabolism regulation signal transduction histidine kinase